MQALTSRIREKVGARRHINLSVRFVYQTLRIRGTWKKGFSTSLSSKSSSNTVVLGGLLFSDALKGVVGAFTYGSSP